MVAQISINNGPSLTEGGLPVLLATPHDSFPATPTKLTTVEPRNNEPLYKEFLGISNHFLYEPKRTSI